MEQFIGRDENGDLIPQQWGDDSNTQDEVSDIEDPEPDYNLLSIEELATLIENEEKNFGNKKGRFAAAIRKLDLKKILGKLLPSINKDGKNYIRYQDADEKIQEVENTISLEQTRSNNNIIQDNIIGEEIFQKNSNNIYAQVGDITSRFQNKNNETIVQLGQPVLTGNVASFKLTAENGVEQVVSLDLSGIVTVDIHTTNATYNASTNIITLSDNSGSEFNIDLSEFSIIKNTDSNGITTLSQEGEVKLVVSRVGQSGDYNDLLNKPDLSIYATVSSVNNKNIEQDNRIANLEGINYTWSPTNRTLTLYDNNGSQLSQVSLVSLDNEGTDLRYNASTLSLELWNSDNELLDSIPVSNFVGNVASQLNLNSSTLQLRDSQGNVLSTVNFSVSNIQNLQNLLDNKEDITNKQNNLNVDNTNNKYPTVTAVLQGLFEKLDKPTTDGSWIVTKSGSTITYTDIASRFQNKNNETIVQLGQPVLTGNVASFKLTAENGVEQVVSLDLSGIATIDIHTTSATYNTSTNIITLSDNSGNEFSIDLSEFSIIKNTDSDGVTTLTQEGVVKLIVSKVGQSGSYNDLLNKPDLTVYTTVEQLNDKLDKPTTDGSWVVTKSGSTITYTDASTLGQNIANTNLTWSADRTQNLNAKKLSFTGGRVSVPALELEITAENSVPNKIWTAGTYLWHTNNLGISRQLAYDENGVNIPQGRIITTTSITTETKTNSNLSQNGKNIIIDNGASNINLTVNAFAGGNFCATYIKDGTGTITIVAGSGVTLDLVQYSDVVNGKSGSRFMISQNGSKNTFKIFVRNYE